MTIHSFTHSLIHSFIHSFAVVLLRGRGARSNFSLSSHFPSLFFEKKNERRKHNVHIRQIHELCKLCLEAWPSFHFKTYLHTHTSMYIYIYMHMSGNSAKLGSRSRQTHPLQRHSLLRPSSQAKGRQHLGRRARASSANAMKLAHTYIHT